MGEKNPFPLWKEGVLSFQFVEKSVHSCNLSPCSSMLHTHTTKGWSSSRKAWEDVAFLWASTVFLNFAESPCLLLHSSNVVLMEVEFIRSWLHLPKGWKKCWFIEGKSGIWIYFFKSRRNWVKRNWKFILMVLFLVFKGLLQTNKFGRWKLATFQEERA